MKRYRHGMIVGKFYPPHSGHHFLIDYATPRCDELTVVVAPSRRESIPLDLRCEWLREAHPDVTIAGIYDDVPVDYGDADIWSRHCAIFREAIGDRTVDAVFSSEPYGDELARRFGAVHVSVDPDRRTRKVSGTAVRSDPVEHWEALTPAVRGWLAKRVVVVGAESTGTTTMAAALAEAYQQRGLIWSRTQWVPEYGRELTARKLDRLRAANPAATVFEVEWSRADFVDVARAQNAAEDAAARRTSPILICDTDAAATAIWEERYLGDASALVRAAARPADLYLLTDHAGVPFEDDGLRDGEHVREWMTGRFRKVIDESGVPCVELTGPHPDRLETAITAIDQLIERGWVFADPL